MKNKKSIYILLPAVVIIWGTLLWKIFQGRDISHDLSVPTTIKRENGSEEKARENIELSYNYKDPFLKTSTKTESVNTGNNSQQEQPYYNTGNMWAEIEYSGIIKTNDKQNMTGLLNINGKKHLLRTGSEVDGIKVIYIHPDSIYLEFQREKRSFRRKGQGI